MHQMRIGAALQRLSVCLVMIAPINLGACGWIEDQYTADRAFSDRTPSERSAHGKEAPFDLLSGCMPADLKKGQCEKPSMEKINDEQDPVKQAIMRNRFQDYLLWRSEQQCERHKAGILANQAMVNFSLSTITTGVATTAALVIAPASNILAGIGAFTSGTRSHFNENFYRQTLAPGIVRKINQTRSSRLGAIMEKRRTPPSERPATVVENKSDADAKAVVPATPATANATKTTLPPSKPTQVVLMADYTLEEAITDVERYHQQCSFVAGLSELIEPGAKFEDTATGIKQRINTLREMQTDNEKQAEALLKGNTQSNRDAANRLRETNADISRQIMILQNQMLTAPLTVDSPTPSTSK